MTIIIIIAILLIGYRMYKFSKKESSVKVHEYELRLRGIECSCEFKLNYGGTDDIVKGNNGDNLYFFTLLYKDFFINGEYIFNEKLLDSELRGMIIQYESKKGKLETQGLGVNNFDAMSFDYSENVKSKHKFMDYKFLTYQKGYPKFYFEVGINYAKGLYN